MNMEGPASQGNGKQPTIEEMIERLHTAGYFVRKNPNRYDRKDMVQREMVMLAGPLKFAVYRVRDAETDEFGPRQFHMTYDNTVIAVMGEEAARLFVTMHGQFMAKTEAEQPLTAR